VFDFTFTSFNTRHPCGTHSLGQQPKGLSNITAFKSSFMTSPLTSTHYYDYDYDYDYDYYYYYNRFTTLW